MGMRATTMMLGLVMETHTRPHVRTHNIFSLARSLARFLAQPHPPACPSTHVRARTHQGLLGCRLLHFCFAVEAEMACEGLSDNCVCVGGWVYVCARVCVRAHTRLCVGACPCARARARASAQSCDRGYDTLACRYQRYEISKAEHSRHVMKLFHPSQAEHPSP